MNPLHHPDHERCKKLTEIGFPMGNDTIWFEGVEKRTGNTLQANSIYAVIAGKQKTAGGFFWLYDNKYISFSK